MVELHPSTVEELNEALRLYRRLLVRLFAIFFLGIIGCWLLSLADVSIFGESLATWSLIAVLVLILAEVWWDGRQIGLILKDPLLKTIPVVGVLSGLGVIAQRAHAMGMRWSGFFGDLRPVRKA